MLPLYFLVLSWMDTLVPNADHRRLATATVTTVMTESPLYRGDESRIRTAALLTAIQFRESSFRPDAVGDNGRSFCSMQIHSSIGGSPALLEDPERCIRVGLQFIRQSISIDRDHPLAFYARGPRFKSIEAQRLSNDRVAIARRLLDSIER